MNRSAVYFPFLLALTWSLYPGLKVYVASLLLPAFSYASKLDLEDLATREEISRQIQQHFHKFDLYVPLEDVVVLSANKDPEKALFFDNLTKTCQDALIYVWLPFTVRLPFLGDVDWEWCKKPTIHVGH